LADAEGIDFGAVTGGRGIGRASVDRGGTDGASAALLAEGNEETLGAVLAIGDIVVAGGLAPAAWVGVSGARAASPAT
jgi:hypothetical protein